MKKYYSLFVASLLSFQLFAGGILTNTNQSAMFTRMQARDATLGIDAVYYNPAGLTFLPNNGFYLSLNNQTLGQTRTIESNYPYLNSANYEGKVFAPMFPGVYAAYKIDNLVLSANFNVIGGGGGGTYEKGLPSFEYSIADLVPALNPTGDPNGAQAYQMNAYFEGSSAWFGYQFNASYQINEMISVALGGRFVQAKDTYEGYLKGVQLNIPGMGGWIPASDVMLGIATKAQGGGDELSPLINLGLGALTPEQAQQAGYIDATTQAIIEGGLTQLGVDPTGLTIEQSQMAYYGASAKYTATASVLGDQSAKTEEKAMGFTPIISVNIKPNDQFNFSLKYEHQTKLEFTSTTESDFTTGFEPDGTPITMFPNGAKKRKDLPSQFVIGATYSPMEKVLISTGFHTYFDKNADWNGKEKQLDGNSWEFALGAEYGLSEALSVSAGWLTTKSGVSEAYQTDLSHSLPSNTIGGGLEYRINPMLNVNLGGSYTMYNAGSKNFEHNLAGSGNMIPVMETYDKDVWIVALGVNFNFGIDK